MKHLLTLMGLLAVLYSFKSHAAFNFEGQVLYQGRTLECLVDNYSYQNVSVLGYRFDLTVRDRFGRIYPVTQNFVCTHNCYISRNAYEIFSGPRAHYNVVAARCFGSYIIVP